VVDLYDLVFLLFGNAIYSVHERLALHCFFLHFFVFFVTHLENRVLNMSSSRKSHHQLEVREEEAGHLRSGFFRFFCFFLTQQIRFQKIASPILDFQLLLRFLKFTLRGKITNQLRRQAIAKLLAELLTNFVLFLRHDFLEFLCDRFFCLGTDIAQLSYGIL